MNVDADAIQRIPAGRALSSRSPNHYVQCARRDGQYVVECGWAVPEAHDDDPESSTYHPFSDRRTKAWVGRETSTTDPERAAELFLAYQAAVESRRGSALVGHVIGSVTR